MNKLKLRDFLENTKVDGKHSPFELFIFGVIILNALIIYLQVSGYETFFLGGLDILCTLIFLVEMGLKLYAWGLKGYWTNGWNRLDGILVILSLPSLLTPFVAVSGGSLSVLLALRLLRVLKFFKVMKFFPNFSKIMRDANRAMKETWAVLAAFAVVILIFALISCSLFREVAPEYFATPMMSFYSIFRLFTIEGWYDIPDAVASGMGGMAIGLIRFYFSVLLIVGGIMGMSLINSIFVDAMAEDNNDAVLYEIRKLQEQIEQMDRKINQLEQNSGR